MKTMKILHVCSWVVPSIGAIHVYLRDILRELSKRGHRVDLLSRTRNWHHVRLKSKGRIVDLKPYYPKLYSIVDPLVAELGVPTSRWVREREVGQYAFELAASKLCDIGKYDLIHAHDVNAARAVRRLLGPTKTPLLLTTHGMQAYEVLIERVIDPEQPKDWAYAYQVERSGVLSASIVVTPSVWMKDEYVRHFDIPPQTIMPIPYGPRREMEGSKRRRAPLDAGRAEDLVTIACVARLVPLKGHVFLLEALRLMKREFRRFRCLIVGSGPLLAELREAVAALGLKKEVRLLGKREDIPEILARSDIFVLPSVQEITPLSIVEAQLAGKPVVASDITGVPELIDDGVSGLLVPPADSDALAAALVRLARAPALRRRLGQNARLKALLERTWEQHFARLHGLYHWLAERSRQDQPS